MTDPEISQPDQPSTLNVRLLLDTLQANFDKQIRCKCPNKKNCHLGSATVSGFINPEDKTILTTIVGVSCDEECQIDATIGNEAMRGALEDTTSQLGPACGRFTVPELPFEV